MKFLVFLLFPGLASAATVQLIDTGGIIPDGSISGLARTLELNRPGETIVSVSIDLAVSGAASPTFLGDLFITLNAGGNLVTLLNRTGRDNGLLDGYDDDQGLDITLTDLAPSDIHTYRTAVTGDESVFLSSTLTGSFQPDGRDTSPLSVLTGDTRTNQFSDFNGLDATQTFTLFAADLSTGASHQLDSWTLNIETTAVPEPSTTLVLTLLGVDYHIDVGSRFQIDIEQFGEDFHAFIEFCYHCCRTLLSGYDLAGNLVDGALPQTPGFLKACQRL